MLHVAGAPEPDGQYEPAGHGSGSAQPAGQYDPPGHVKQFAVPRVGAYVPALHWLQPPFCVPDACEPGGHSVAEAVRLGQ